MIDYDPTTRTVTMTLGDLEKCGFDPARMAELLEERGIGDLQAQWPARLVVLYREGAVRIVDAPAPDGLTRRYTGGAT